MDILESFSAPTAAWFRGAFAKPTDAQAGAWAAIAAGRHALVVAPTGSGKTLSAFLWALDRVFLEERGADALPGFEGRTKKPSKRRTKILYISPLKALGVDVERNLQSPLVGITQAAKRLGVDLGSEAPLQGAILADAFGHTSVAGVWAVGEAVGDPATGMRPMSVVDAMASGQRAGAAVVRSVLQ